MDIAPLRWCFIGTGHLAEKVAKQLLPSGRHVIVSCFSRRAESREAFAKRFGGKPCASSLEAMNLPEVDAVYIVTPHNTHYCYAKEAIEAGKPCFVEKPFTVRADETKELIALAQEKGVYLAEAMWTWFSPLAHQVKEWVDDGTLGEIQKARITFNVYSMGYGPRVRDPHRAGGALLDLGVYPITYAYRLFGKPTEIRCQGKLKDGIDLGEVVELAYPNGFVATAEANISSFRGMQWLRLEGSKGSVKIFIPHSASKAKFVPKKGKPIFAMGETTYLNEFDRVREDILAGKKESELVPLSCTVDVMEILDECRKQMGLIYPFEPGYPGKTA